MLWLLLPTIQLFEEIVAEFQIPSSIVVRALETIPIELAREGVAISNLTEQHFRDCFALVAGAHRQGRASGSAACLAEHPMERDEAANAAGLAGVDEAAVDKAVQAIVATKPT